jgi:preprotein translocase subunit YajC
MKKMFASVLLTLLVLLFVVQPQVAQAQCAMCKTNVESARNHNYEEDAYDVSGLNSGIVYLMVIPYVLIGAFGFFWYRNSKQRKQLAR